jgi:hypothetical protein
MPAGLGLLRRRSAQGLKPLDATFSDGPSPANNPPSVNL